jgi:hypothetical protein
MTTSLTKEEMISIIGQHKRTLELNKYNLQLALIQENALVSPNTENISSLNDQITDSDRKLAALDAELENINS